MSIRDFDPILKRGAERAARTAARSAGAKTGLHLKKSGGGGPDISFIPSVPTPIKLSAGKRNIRVGDTSSGAVLAARMNEAFAEIAGEFRWYTEQLDNYLPNDLALALVPTMEMSKLECPKDTHDLVNSAYLAVEKFRGGARVEIGYARGDNPDYAVFVHEMVDHKHQAPTKAKFLQDPVNQDYFNIITRVTQNIKARSGT